jgi:peptidoglycan/LPS O-acetylase OafA/YrhL
MPASQTMLAPSENRLFYPALDGLRAIALLMVFFAHYIELPWGWTGVEVFFVLSGFLITGILFDTRDTPHRVRNFYLRRTLRIFPLYYGVALIVLLCWPVFHWHFSWLWLLWPAYLGNYLRYLQPFAPHSIFEQLADLQIVGNLGHQQVRLILGHFWSLCVEEQFYLVWPWAVFFVRSRRTLIWICAASLPVCLVARILCGHLLPPWMIENGILQRATPLHIDALLLGGLLALVLRGPQAARLLRMANPALIAATVVIIVWFVLTPAHHLFANPYPQPANTDTIGLTLIDLYAALVILTAIQPESLLFRPLSRAPLRWLGRISYGAYVFHDAPHALYSRFAASIAPNHTTSATTLIALVCTLVLASLSYRFFESPFLRLKSRFSPHPSVP